MPYFPVASLRARNQPISALAAVFPARQRQPLLLPSVRFRVLLVQVPQAALDAFVPCLGKFKHLCLKEKHMTSRALIAGATGLIGSNLANHLSPRVGRSG